MSKKLFTTTLEVTVVVAANNAQEAQAVGKAHAPAILAATLADEIQVVAGVEVSREALLPTGWTVLDFPYGPIDNKRIHEYFGEPDA